MVAIAALLLCMGFLGFAVVMHSGTKQRAAIFVAAAIAAAAFVPGAFGAAAGAVAVTLLSGLGFLLSPRPRIAFPPHFKWFAAYLALSILVSWSRGYSPVFALSIAVSLVSFAMLLAHTSVEDDQLITGAVIIIGAATALLCVYEGLVASSPVFAQTAYGEGNPLVPGTIRAQATLGHPLVAGFFMLVTASFVVLRVHRRLVAAPLVALLLAGVVSTGSTSALVIAVAAVCLTWFFAASTLGQRTMRAVVILSGAYLGWRAVVTAELIEDLSGANAEHRLNSLRSVPHLLFDRGLLEGLFGSGGSAVRELFERGFFPNDYFFTVDNQFVTALAAGGVVGLVLLVAYVVNVLGHRTNTYWVVVAMLVVMFLSFEVLSWLPTSLLFVLSASLAVRGPQEVLTAPTLARRAFGED